MSRTPPLEEDVTDVPESIQYTGTLPEVDPTHFNPENNPSFKKIVSATEDRIVIEEDELSVIEEESTSDISTTTDLQTEAVRASSFNPESGTLFDTTSEKKFLSTDDCVELKIKSENVETEQSKPSKQVSYKGCYKSSQETLVQLTDLSENESESQSYSSTHQKRFGNEAGDDVIAPSVDFEFQNENGTNDLLHKSGDIQRGDTIVKETSEYFVDNDNNINPRISPRQLSSDSETSHSEIEQRSDNTRSDVPLELSEFSDSIESGNVSLANSQNSSKRQLSIEYASYSNKNSRNNSKNNSRASDIPDTNNKQEHHLESRSSIDNRHNATYSLQQQTTPTNNTNRPTPGDGGDGGVKSVRSFQPASSNNSSHIDSEELINFLEKDAQRDILGDYPDLPLDDDVDQNENKAVTLETKVLDQTEINTSNPLNTSSVRRTSSSELPPKPWSRSIKTSPNMSDTSRRSSRGSQSSSKNNSPKLSPKSLVRSSPSNSPSDPFSRKFNSPREPNRKDISCSSSSPGPGKLSLSNLESSNVSYGSTKGSSYTLPQQLSSSIKDNAELSPKQQATSEVEKTHLVSVQTVTSDSKTSTKLTDRVPSANSENRNDDKPQKQKSTDSSSIPLLDTSDIDEDSIESDIMFSSLKLSSVLTSTSNDVVSASNDVVSVDFPTDDENTEDIELEHHKESTQSEVSKQKQKYQVDDEHSELPPVSLKQPYPDLSSSDIQDVIKVPERLRNSSETEEDSRASSTKSVRRSLKFELENAITNIKPNKDKSDNNIKSEKESDTDDPKSDLTDDLNDDPVKITKPIKNIYSLAGYDISSASDPASDDAFDVTSMGTLDDTDLRVGTSPGNSMLIQPELSSTAKTTGDKVMSHSELTGHGKTPHEQPVTVPPGEVHVQAEFDIPDNQPITEDDEPPEKCRIFIALYTYDPKTMSPNVEYSDDELAFKKGDLIKVLDDTDEDGFYFGELNGKSGMVPGNMVAEVNTEDNSIKTENQTEDSFDLTFMLDKENGTTKKSPTVGKSLSASAPSIVIEEDVVEPSLTNQSVVNHSYLHASQSMPDLHSDNDDQLEDGYHNDRIDPYKLPPQLMVALYDYDPAVSSPNVDSEVGAQVFKSCPSVYTLSAPLCRIHWFRNNLLRILIIIYFYVD